VNEGAAQTFTITPAAGYFVADVLVDGASVGAVTSYAFAKVVANHTLTAIFGLLPTHTITASAGPNGEISPAGSTSVFEGGAQIFAILPHSGYAVEDVRVDGASVGPVSSYKFSDVRAAHTISATFRVPTVFMITADAGDHGAISPMGSMPVIQGTSQIFTMTPDHGYGVESVTVDGISVGSGSSYTFENVQAAHTISVTFKVVTVGDLVWSDEFDGPSLDTTKWAFDIGTGANNDGWGNGEWEYYTSSQDNVAIEDGKLVITAKPDSFGGKGFTSARLVTRGKYSFNHGRFVARIRMPEGNMIWPAFWLLGDHMEAWPKCGEIDIAEMFCGSVGKGDNAVFATGHWFHEVPDPGGYASYGLTYALTDDSPEKKPIKLSAGYHDYELVWDDQYLRAKFDGTEYWVMDITNPALSELKDHNFYIILNVAVGQPQWKMTSPSQANGTLPQKMYVDSIHVYSNETSKVVDKVAEQRHGNFGILADGTTCAAAIDFASDANLYVWNNLTSVVATPAAGTQSIALRTNDTSWFGFGIATTNRHNFLNYAGGYLNVSMKTTSTDTFKVGLSGGASGEAWVSFKSGSDPYGFVRDGQWHAVTIPMTLFGNVDFTDILQYFMVVSDGAVNAGRTLEFDEIYYSENAPENIMRPTGTRFGIFTDSACDAGTFVPGTDGGLYVWNTANNQANPSVPFEGANSFAYTAPAAQWWGLGFTPTKLYDLSVFAKGHLHVAMKVPATSTTNFKLGLKSPGGTAIRESWIKFVNGADPYGMVRDGQYHELLIPAADFCNSDFSAIAQLLMIAGDGPATIEFDDVYWTNN